MKNFLKINRALVAKIKLTFLLTFLCLSAGVWADYVDVISLTNMDTYSQNFDAIGGQDVTEADIAAAGAGTGDANKRSVLQDSELPDGWKVEKITTYPHNIGAFSSISTKTTYVGGVSLPNNAKNGTWNFGATGSTDRAIGGLSTGTANGSGSDSRGINVMAHLHNNIGLDINSIALSYDIEKYRNGSNSSGFTVALFTSTDGSTWTSAGDPFSTVYSADESTAGSADVPINSTTVNGLLKVSFPANGDLYLAWNISVTSGNTCSQAQGLAIDNVSITPKAVASNELFATYQKQGDRFYKGANEADLEADHFDWNVNYYIVSCGDSILLRATTTEDRNFTAGWQTQLRLWTTAWGTGNEIQTNAGGGTKNCYTSICRHINYTSNDIKLQFFVNWEDNCVTQTYDFNRASINNPIVDNIAPIIDPNDVTMAEVNGKLVFTFGDVTADDEYFYYVGDKDHNLGGISLGNKVYITKPTVQDGTTYKFKCYAVDYNGNKSAYKEFTLVMPFDPAVDLALNKKASAGAVQIDNTADRAINGNADNFWTCYGQGDVSTTWWKVDLNNSYDVSSISIHFNDINAAYNIYISNDDSNWTPIIEGATASSNETKSHTSINHSGRYLKVTSSDNRFGIREFNVYATGVSVPDNTNPTVSVTEISKTVNSVTLQIIALDEDDLGNAGTITAINISGDHGFVTQNNVVLDASNQITLSGLTYNTTYTFTIQAVDLAGNDATANIEVALPFNTDYNLSLQGTATAGYRENENTKSAKAIDGDSETKWNTWNVGSSSGGYANNWMRVDLGAAYNLRNVTMSFDWHYGNPVTEYVIEGSLDDSNWYLIDHVTNQSETSASMTVIAPARYVRFRAITHQSLGIYEFEVYASGFSTLTDSKPVVTYAKVGEVTDATAEIEIDAVDITTMPITTYMVGGVEEDPIEVTASEGKINLTSLSQSTNYSISIQAKDGNGNLSDAKVLAFTTAGGVSGLYCYAEFFGWGEKAQDQARFSTTAEPNVLRLAVANLTTGDHNFKLYNADADRCTSGDCGGPSDHHFNLASATDVTFYATDEDHFVCTADNLYLRGTLVSEDKALVWNDAHTKATWSGTVDLSGTKQYTLVKNNGNSFIYDHDIYDAAQTYDGELTDVTFTFDATKMTGTWSEHAYPVTLDETIDNSTTISNNNGRLADVTLARGFIADGGNYTLCLPFNMTAEQCAEAFHDGYQLWYLEDSRLKDNGDIYLNFISADNIVAGRPYLFCPAENVASGTVIENVHINSAASTASNSTYANFVGTYDKIPQATLNANNKAYLLGEENWLFSAVNLRYDMKALRAYFELNPDVVNNVHPRMRVVFNEPRTDMPTDIEDVEQVAAPAKRIVNGQLIIEKNGILYNAQGKRLQ